VPATCFTSVLWELFVYVHVVSDCVTNNCVVDVKGDEPEGEAVSGRDERSGGGREEPLGVLRTHPL
jgi:hypothetical protein